MLTTYVSDWGWLGIEQDTLGFIYVEWRPSGTQGEGPRFYAENIPAELLARIIAAWQGQDVTFLGLVPWNGDHSERLNGE